MFVNVHVQCIKKAISRDQNIILIFLRTNLDIKRNTVFQTDKIYSSESAYLVDYDFWIKAQNWLQHP